MRTKAEIEFMLKCFKDSKERLIEKGYQDTTHYARQDACFNILEWVLE